MTHILHIDTSGKHTGSTSRTLSKQLVDHLKAASTTVTYRDVSTGLPFVEDVMISAYYTPAENHNAEQKMTVAISDTLVAEVMAADTIVIGAPMYNFNITAAFKAWIDLVARVGKTFKYTENGPVGLLKDKKVYLVVTTGGTPLGSAWDHLSPYLTTVFAFIGITDVEILAADTLGKNLDAKLAELTTKINALPQAA